MRLVTYDRGGFRRLGAQVNGVVVDLPEVVGHPAFPRTLETFVVAGSRGTVLDAARSALAQPAYLHDCDVPGARLLAPLLIGGEDVVVGPDAELAWPGTAERIDCEPEIACVVGREGRDLSPAQAEEAILGYTVANGWWVVVPGRPREERALFATSMGPCLVTADEVDLRRSHLVARVDGGVWLEADLRATATVFARNVARASAARGGVRPGDLFSARVSGEAGSGRLFGSRAGRRGARGGHHPLAPDVVVEVEVSGIGTLRNRVSLATPATPPTRDTGATPLMPSAGPPPAPGRPPFSR